MNWKKNIPDLAFDFLNIALMVILSFIFVYPLVYVIFASFSDPAEYVKHSGFLLHPLGFSLRGYNMVLKTPHILTGYLNTGFYVIAGVAINMVMSCLGVMFSRGNSFIYAKP
jgi:putative aldouronate transport system permease protein